MSNTIDPRTPDAKFPMDGSYTQELTNNADTKEVATGAGGTSVVRDRDSMIPPGPSQEGIPGAERQVMVLTSDPRMPEPQLAEKSYYGRSSEAPDSPRKGINRGLDAFGNWAGRQIKGLFKFDEIMPGLESQGRTQAPDDSDDVQLVRDAIKEFKAEHEESSSDPSIGQPTTSAGPLPASEDPLDAWINTLKELSSSVGNVSKEDSKVSQGMQSQNPEEIAKTLLETSGLETRDDISQDNKDMIISKFKDLAQAIANKNKEGGAPILKFGIAGLIACSFAQTLRVEEDATLNKEQKDLLETLLYNSAEAVAKSNFQKFVSREEPSPEYTTLTGEDPQAIQKLITSFLPDFLPEKDFNKLTKEQKNEVGKILGGLSGVLADKSYDPSLRSRLLSHDPEVVAQALSAILGTIEGAPPMVQELMAKTIIPAISAKMGSINEIELNAQLKSSDPEAIESALGILSGVSHDDTIPPNEKKIIQDYLRVLTQALAFMAQIRSLITRLEGAFTQELAAARMANIADQIKNAMDTYNSKLEEITKKYLDNASKIRTSEILKIVMPIVSVLLLVVAVAILIITIAVTIVTAGAGSPSIALAAKLLALTVALVITLMVLAYTVVDTIITWATNKSIMDSIMDKMGIEDQTLRKALVMAINIAIILAVGALTLGAGLLSGIVMMKGQLASMSAQAAVKFILELIKETIKQLFTGSIGAQILGMLLGAVFSSGFVQDVVMKIFKALGLDDEKAMIATIILMMILMLMMILATSGKSIVAGVKGLASSAKTVAENIANQVKEALNNLKALLKKILEAIKESVNTATTSSVKEGFSQLIKEIGQMLKEIAEAVGKKILDLSRSVKDSVLEKIKGVLGLGSSGEKIATSTSKSAVDQAMAANRTIIEKILRRMLEMCKENPMIFPNMIKLLTAALQMAAQGVNAHAAYESAHINKDLAKIARETAALEAVMGYLKAAGQIGPKTTMEAINESSQEMFEDWKKLCNMVAKFILDASQRTTELHSRAV